MVVPSLTVMSSVLILFNNENNTRHITIPETVFFVLFEAHSHLKLPRLSIYAEEIVIISNHIDLSRVEISRLLTPHHI
jgi:hypothetical protein